MYVQGKNVLSSLQTDGVCVYLGLPPFGLEAGGGEEGFGVVVVVAVAVVVGGVGGRKSDRMTENEADEKINPVARDGTETERKEGMMEI